MSLWSKISEIVSRLQIADSVGVMIDRLVETVRSLVAGTPESRQVSFTISMIALAAKMAKADGVVTDDEVSIVRRLFEVPESERRNVARLFNLAKQDIAGFETYAARLRRLHDDDRAMLEDILDGLFIIAASDAYVHEAEGVFLERVAEIFGLDRATYARIEARHVPLDAADPYVVLGIPRGSTPTVARRAFRRLAAENHPDALIARGVPVECEKLANERMAAINAAYEAIERELIERELVD